MTGLTFSLGQGIIHPYYTVALAPAIGALVGIGGGHAVGPSPRRRSAAACWPPPSRSPRCGRSSCSTARPTWYPGLRGAVLIAGLVAAGVLLALHRGSTARALVAVALAGVVADPGRRRRRTPSTPSPRRTPAPSRRRSGRSQRPSASAAGPSAARCGTGRQFRGGAGPPPAAGHAGGFAGGRLPGGTAAAVPPGAAACSTAASPTVRPDRAARTATPARTTGWPRPSAPTTRPATSWPPATPVMAIGGFNGTDPTPTLAQFQTYVARGKVHYFIAGGTAVRRRGSRWRARRARRPPSPPGCGQLHGETVGGVTVYDLTSSST